jgi:hypothetical protein
MITVFTKETFDNKYAIYRKSNNGMYDMTWDGKGFYSPGFDSQPQKFDTEKEAVDFSIKSGWFVEQRFIGLCPANLAPEQCPFYAIFMNNQTWINFKQVGQMPMDKVSLGKFIVQLEKFRDEMKELEDAKN